MKKIKTINKLLSSLTLLSPLAGIRFNNQNQNTQNVITESSNNSLNNYFSSNAQEKMGDITVTVDGTKITGYVEGTGDLVVDSDITEIAASAFLLNSNINGLDLSQATSLTSIGREAFAHCSNLTGDLMIPNKLETIGDTALLCTLITSLDLSRATNLTSIGISAFNSCTKLTGELYIPKNLNNIPSSAFNGTYFTSFTVDPENQQFSLATNLGPEAQVLLTDNTGILDAEFSNIFTPFVLGTIELPEDITIIPASLFDYICGDIILDFKNCVNNIQSIGTNFALSWGETKVNIKNLDITNMINLQEIKENAFVGPNFLDPFKLDFRNLENKITISNDIFSSHKKNFLPIVGDVVFPKLIDNIPSNILVSSEPLTGDIYFLSETVPTFNSDWKSDTLQFSGKVYVPSEAAKEAYLGAPNFGFSADQVEIGLPPKPTPTPEPSKSNMGLIIGLSLGIGIPIILAVGFGIYYLTKKKKIIVKI